MARLLLRYNKEIIPFLLKEFNYSNVMQVPRLEKVVINVGVGSSLEDKKYLDLVMQQLQVISGQLPVKRVARKSIANFKLREGSVVGCKVTLRKKRMYEFFDRLVNVALPRLKDFRGLSLKSFDGYGNYSLGISEHVIFPEVDFNKVEKVMGMDITFVTSALNNDVARVLLQSLGMPFENKKLRG